MSAAEEVYSNEEITMERGNTDGSANSQVESTYSEFGIVKRRPSTELHDGRCRVTSERAAVFVLSVLLAAYLITLGLHSHQNIQTTERLQKMRDERDAEIQTLTERFSAVRPESTRPEGNRGSSQRCPDGWERHGGKCYYFSIIKATWTRSRAECRRTGGDLVKIESREEQTFLEQRVRVQMTEDQDKFWIGLTDSESEGAWLWSDGSALDDQTPLDSGLPFWSKGEPDDYKVRNTLGEDCARMGERGGVKELKCWFDASCEVPHRSICERNQKTLTH